MSKKRKRRKPDEFLPEFPGPAPRAGFIPNHDYDQDADVVLWQVWMRSDEGHERRARHSDIKALGYRRRKR